MTDTQLIPSEEVCFQIWMRKRAQVEAYGLHVPPELLDDMNEWGQRWRSLVWKSMSDSTGFDELSFGLLVKQFERKWSEK